MKYDIQSWFMILYLYGEPYTLGHTMHLVNNNAVGVSTLFTLEKSPSDRKWLLVELRFACKRIVWVSVKGNV